MDEMLIVTKNNLNSTITGEKTYDRRDKLEGEGGIVPEPSRLLPPDVRTQYRYLQRLIRKSKKAKAAISVGDQEIIVNVATSIAMQRELADIKAAGGLDADKILRINRQMLQIGADIRQGLTHLLLTPNSRARVVVTESPTSENKATLFDLLNPPSA
jgi:hypothetical protein